ncbi:transposase family protein [Candidatus Saccharibacteria bacterium]|nr:transposase family protein [Candidatus Saccharibacteria bacterium]
MKMLVIEKKPVGVVADRFGVNRTTIWRWYQKWLVQNNHIELENPVRRKYLGVSAYKYKLCKWDIHSLSAAPKSPHTLSEDLVQLVLDVRDQLIKPINSLNTILEAEQYFGFKFKMVQSDNGLEFSNYFSDRLEKRGIKIRHTRLGRPNDNAHIERFNRTLQEECTGNYYLESESLKKMDDKILSYIDFYNYHRVHLSISYRTPSQMLQRL